MKKKDMRLFRIIIIILLLIVCGLLILDNYNIFGRKITGNVVDGADQNGETILPRHIFYDYLRADINDYSDSCYPQSSVMPVLPNTVCCEGLEQIAVIDEAQQGCTETTGVALCSACGNNVCDYGENDCNCPIDCNSPPTRL